MAIHWPTLLSVEDAKATRRLRLQVGFAFAIAASVSGFVIDSMESEQLSNQRALATSVAERQLRTLDQSIHHALSATYAVAALVKQGRGQVPDFEAAARQLIDLYPGVGAIQLAPGGVIRASVPLAGNEKAIGHDLLKDPARTKEAFLARDTGKLTLAGPFTLIQGGLGAVGRLPVFLPGNAGQNEFWGFTSVLIRFPAVLEAGGLGKLKGSGYHYVLWRIHPDSGDRQVIAHSGPALLDDPVNQVLDVPNGRWTLSIEPVSGWGNRTEFWFSVLIGTLLSLMFTILAAFVLRQPILLQEVVARRTRDLVESEQRFQSLFEQAPVALSVTTMVDGYVATQWNRTWLTTFGYRPEEAQGKSGNQIGLWVHPEDRKRYIDQAITTGSVRGFEVPMRCADGSARTVSVSGRFIESDKHKLLLTSYDDVTDARRQEQEIRELNATLESRVDSRTRELKKSNNELWNAVTSLERTQQELVRSEKMAALGSLVAGIAHELNTPIGNAVTVCSSLTERTRDFEEQVKAGLRRSVLDQFISEMKTGLDILFKNQYRAAELISSFKQVAVDQASQVRRQFDLATTIQEIVTTLSPSFNRLPVSVKTSAAENVLLDSYPGPFGQVLVNLVNNALIHAFDPEQTGNIAILAERLDDPETDTANPWVRITVSDDGRGITPEHLPRIFDPFFTTRLGAGGSGLGLNISYNIVTTLLGGRIHAFSEPGKGTRMVIELPTIAPTIE